MATMVEAEELAALRRELAETRAALGLVQDRLAIQDLLNTYARGIDRADLDVLKGVFHEGSLDEHGMFRGSGDEFADFITPYIRGNYRMMQHHHTTTSIAIDGDEGEAETYFLCIQAKPNDDLEFSAGRVADRFERRAGRWGLVYRQVIMDWTWLVEGPVATSIDDQFVKGLYAGEDASYRVVPRLREASVKADAKG